MNGSLLCEALDEYVTFYEAHDYFSGSVLVVRDGEVLLRKGYGLANRELHVPNRTATKFRLASMSKQFVAAATLKLHEQGKLDIKVPIQNYIPDYPNGDHITVHHLLTHSSGLSNPDELSETTHYANLEDLVRLFRDKPLRFEPGSQFGYNYSSYTLLLHIIETVTGKGHVEYFHDALFQPLGLTSTGFDANKEIIPERASGYYVDENRFVNGKFVDMSVYAGAAGIYSTIDDLYRWNQILGSDEFISRSSLEQMFTPHINNYGYGWHIDDEGIGGTTRRRAHHGGLNDGGFSPAMVRYMEDRVFIVSLSNMLLAPQEKMMKDLGSIVFDAPFIPPRERPRTSVLGPGNFSKFVGTYEGSMPIPVTREGDQLFITIFGFKIGLFPAHIHENSALFFSPLVYVDVTFAVDGDGTVDTHVRWLGDEGFHATMKQV